jgi:hypothetical protein
MGIHLLRYTHGNKCMGTHYVVHDTFATIARDVGFHMGWKQLHVFPLATFNSFHQWVDIVFTKDGIHTLVGVVIANPMHADLFPWSCIIQRFDASDAIQTKKNSYCDQYPTDQFFLLANEVFGCLHKQTNVLLHNCANAIWSLKRPESLPIFFWLLFFIQKFQLHANDTSILHLKSSNNDRPTYFSTSTPSRCTQSP